MICVLASGNKGKLKELADLLSDFGLQLRPQSDFDVPDADETGLSFVENAILKARHAARLTGHPAIADDSGLEVDALNGAPGIYSARFAGRHGDDTANNQKLLQSLSGLRAEKRSARFRCALAYMRHADDPAPILGLAAWEGQILDAPQGEQGFGYDPLFWVPSENMSSAELPRERKNAISHRAQALAALAQEMKRQGL